jgi:hypothetical protein
MCLYNYHIRHSDSSIFSKGYTLAAGSQNTKSPDSGNTLSITISSNTIYVSTSATKPLPPLGPASREGADPLWPHPCRQEPAISPVAVQPRNKSSHRRAPHGRVSHRRASHERVPYGRTLHRRVPHKRVFHRRAPHERASHGPAPYGCVPHRRALHGRATHRRVPHGCTPHRRVLYERVYVSKSKKALGKTSRSPTLQMVVDLLRSEL